MCYLQEVDCASLIWDDCSRLFRSSAETMQQLVLFRLEIAYGNDGYEYLYRCLCLPCGRPLLRDTGREGEHRGGREVCEAWEL